MPLHKRKCHRLSCFTTPSMKGVSPCVLRYPWLVTWLSKRHTRQTLAPSFTLTFHFSFFSRGKRNACPPLCFRDSSPENSFLATMSSVRLVGSSIFFGILLNCSRHKLIFPALRTFGSPWKTRSSTLPLECHKTWRDVARIGVKQRCPLSRFFFYFWFFKLWCWTSNKTVHKVLEGGNQWLTAGSLIKKL